MNSDEESSTYSKNPIPWGGIIQPEEPKDIYLSKTRPKPSLTFFYPTSSLVMDVCNLRTLKNCGRHFPRWDEEVIASGCNLTLFLTSALTYFNGSYFVITSKQVIFFLAAAQLLFIFWKRSNHKIDPIPKLCYLVTKVTLLSAIIYTIAKLYHLFLSF